MDENFISIYNLLLVHDLEKYAFVTLKRVYRQYISPSREFTRLGLLAFLWINLNENSMETRNSHNIMYMA